MRRFCRAMCLVVLATWAPAWGWWPAGHGIMTHAAVKALPEGVPAFFRAGGTMIAHCSFDPDVSKNRTTPYVRDAERPEHYIDLELLGGRRLPKGRYAFIQLCEDLDVEPEDVGLVPYAVAEWTERLAVAFAEHRTWPDNPSIQSKCLVYAGFIAHYAQDLCQPLHVTIHFDGRANPDGTSPRTGIHAKVDGLIQRLNFDPDALAAGQEILPFADLMPGILEELERSRSLIDRVYALEKALPPATGPWMSVPDVVDFATERAREAARFTAALFLTAWERSARIELPAWLERKDDGQAARRQ